MSDRATPMSTLADRAEAAAEFCDLLAYGMQIRSRPFIKDRGLPAALDTAIDSLVDEILKFACACDRSAHRSHLHDLVIEAEKHFPADFAKFGTAFAAALHRYLLG